MKNQTDFKDILNNKFIEFQLIGLESYHNYLKQQLIIRESKANWETYKKYIEKEIIRVNKKIDQLKDKEV